MAYARELALNALLQQEKGAFSNIIVKETLEANPDLSPEERGFFTRLFEGTVENRLFLDHVLDSFSSVKTKKMKPVIRNLLRMSVYQILFLDRIPDSAAINEAVKLAAKRKFANLKGFVNGVLRNIARENEKATDLDYFLADLTEEKERISVRYSLPLWLVEHFSETYGTKKAEEIAAAFSSEKPIHLWLNPAKDRTQLLKKFESDGVFLQENPLFSGTGVPAYYAKGQMEISGSSAFKEGGCYIQDTASLLDSSIAAACLRFSGKEAKVLDVCAAPGGKTLFTALTQKDATICCRDLSEKKVNLIIENIRRLGPENVYPEVWDARKKHKDDQEKYDLVIADLPCSGLGVLGRKSDIKYRIKKEDLTELASLQREILSVVAETVKPGGYLLYSTCTVNPEENEENAAFIRENLRLEPVTLNRKDSDGFLPQGFLTDENCFIKDNELQLLPQTEPYHDGFYLALFQKQPEEV